MKVFKRSVVAASLLLSAQAFAIPTFHDLVVQANNSGGDYIDEFSFFSTAIGFDALWSKQGNSAIKFKAEISGYNNSMGYANADGSGRTTILNEGDTGWKTINPGTDPFVFMLSTNQGNEWFSDNSLNADGLDHLLAFQKNDGSDRYIFFWDDQNGGGDRDFNDFVARVNFVSPSQVPEPGTFALMGLALVGLGVSRRKKKV